jgi:hypothetical protein
MREVSKSLIADIKQLEANGLNIFGKLLRFVFRAGADYKCITQVFLYMIVGLKTFAQHVKETGQFCYLCKALRFCMDSNHKDKPDKYSCGACSDSMRRRIGSPIFRKRRDDIACIFGIAILSILFDISPHAPLRIGGIQRTVLS